VGVLGVLGVLVVTVVGVVPEEEGAGGGVGGVGARGPVVGAVSAGEVAVAVPGTGAPGMGTGAVISQASWNLPAPMHSSQCAKRTSAEGPAHA
jgi:hypothetical protein